MKIFKYIKNKIGTILRHISSSVSIRWIFVFMIVISSIASPIIVGNKYDKIYNERYTKINNKIDMLVDMYTETRIMEENKRIMDNETVEATLIPNSHYRSSESLLYLNNIDPSLLFAIIYARSGGELCTTTPDSDIQGYGLMSEDTSRWIYEEIMNRKNYTHVMQTDGQISTEIIAYYLSHLMKVHNGDIEKVCYSYIGKVDEAFYNRVLDYIKASNKSPEIITNKYRRGVNNDR